MSDQQDRINLGGNLVVTVDRFEPPLLDEPAMTLSFWPVNTKDPMPGFNVTMNAKHWKAFREFIFGIER